MRSLLFAIACLLIAGGILAIAYPRAVAIPHAPGKFMRSGATEYMSADRAVVSGFFSLGFGAVALWGALSWKGWDAEATEERRKRHIQDQIDAAREPDAPSPKSHSPGPGHEPDP